MRRDLTRLALALMTPLAVAAPQGSLETFIGCEMPTAGVPGMAWVIVRDGAVTAIGSRGVARIGADTPITPDTPFLIGSVTKGFTALAVMQLVEAGRLDLDRGIGEYLDAFAGRPAGAITVRQLLSHTSGLSTLQGNKSHGDHDAGPDALARRVEQMAAWTPADPPGSHWAYSNANYVILGRLIEVVSGEDYASYVTTHILQPIGMTHSFVADGQVHAAMAAGHRPWFGIRRPFDGAATGRAIAPAGGVIASARDMGRYLQVMLNGEDDILSARGKAAMMEPASPGSPAYGLGWYLDPGDGSVWHAGSSPGFSSLAMMLPAERKGVAVLVNAGAGMGFGETAPLLDGVATRALGLTPPAPDRYWGQKALFLALALLPLIFLACMPWAWRHRQAIRAKTGDPFGRFSLWFPLATTLAGAWIILWLVPRLFGVSIATLRLFAPDLGLALVATAVTGVAWALFRLGVAYGGRGSRAGG